MTGIIPKRVSTLPALPGGMDNASVATTFSMQSQVQPKLRAAVAACGIEGHRALIRSGKANKSCQTQHCRRSSPKETVISGTVCVLHVKVLIDPGS